MWNCQNAAGRQAAQFLAMALTKASTRHAILYESRVIGPKATA